MMKLLKNPDGIHPPALARRDAPSPRQRSRAVAARGSKRLGASGWVGENGGLFEQLSW